MRSTTGNSTPTLTMLRRNALCTLLTLLLAILFSSSAFAAPKATEAAKKATGKTAEKTTGKNSPKTERVKILNMGLSKDGDTELLCMDFTAPRYPELKTLDGGNPRIFFDVYAVEKWEGKNKYAVDGMIIKSVRTGYSKKEDRVRIVMDLNPRFTYDVKSAFDEERNLFCVGIAIRTILDKKAAPDKTTAKKKK